MLRSFYLIRRHQLFIKRLGKEEHHFLFIYCKINIFLKKSINLIMIFFSAILYYHLGIVEFINEITTVSNKNLFIFPLLHPYFVRQSFDTCSTVVRQNTSFSEPLSKDTRTTLEQTLFLVLSFLSQTRSNKGKLYFSSFFISPPYRTKMDNSGH